MLKLSKAVVQVVLVEENEDGEIVGERVSQPVELFGIKKLREFVDKLPEEIRKAEDDQG